MNELFVAPPAVACGHRPGCSCQSAWSATPLTRRRLLRTSLAGAMATGLGSAAALSATGCASTAGSQAPGRRLLRGGTVLTMDTRLGDFLKADVLIQGETILAVGPSLSADGAEVIDATGCIVIPGFVDTHRHLWEGVLRNALPDGSLGDYLREILGRFGPLFRPEDVYAGNLVSALGALDAGVTTVLDWSHIQITPQHTEAAIQALRDSGIRGVFAYGGPQLGKRWWTDSSHEYPHGLRRLRAQQFSSEDQLLTLALAASGPNFGTQEVALREWQMAREVGVRLSTHLGVGPTGRGTLEPLGRAGQLNIPATYIHCNNLSETEWKMIADSGGTVSVSPQVELNMGHGIPVTQLALDHGIRPSLSVDVETSLPGDFFSQMRIAVASQRGQSFERTRLGERNVPAPMSARAALEFATVEGARANGLLHKVGTLTPGKQADIVMLRADRINVLPVNDPVGAVVQGMDTSNVDTVLVAGHIRKRGGHLVGVDVKRVQGLVQASQSFLITRANTPRP